VHLVSRQICQGAFEGRAPTGMNKKKSFVLFWTIILFSKKILNNLQNEEKFGKKCEKVRNNRKKLKSVHWMSVDERRPFLSIIRPEGGGVSRECSNQRIHARAALCFARVKARVTGLLGMADAMRRPNFLSHDKLWNPSFKIPELFFVHTLLYIPSVYYLEESVPDYDCTSTKEKKNSERSIVLFFKLRCGTPHCR